MPVDSGANARWRKLQDLFDLALTMDVREREAFLASHCADDPDLQQEVLDMIHADESSIGVGLLRPEFRTEDVEPYPPGTRVGHYEVERRIGKGGMGVVYKARDSRLDRTVALKCLPPHLSGDPVSRQRFVVEAKSASRLDHPNICVIYDIGDGPDGGLFLTMPHYDGETLDRHGPG